MLDPFISQSNCVQDLGPTLQASQLLPDFIALSLLSCVDGDLTISFALETVLLL